LSNQLAAGIEQGFFQSYSPDMFEQDQNRRTAIGQVLTHLLHLLTGKPKITRRERHGRRDLIHIACGFVGRAHAQQALQDHTVFGFLRLGQIADLLRLHFALHVFVDI